MTEWWTYRLSDFLMFSPRTYWRLVENYNREMWPAQVVVLVATVAVMAIAASRGSRRWTVGAYVLFAAAWANVAWSFCLERYQDIFTGAGYLAAASGAQVLMLVAAAFTAQAAQMRSVSWWPAMVAVVGYPEVTGAAEWFGFMPDPTALATVLVVLGTQKPVLVRIGLSAVPFAVLVVGWGTRVNLAGVS
jgi:hypothetical protein